MSTSLQQQPTTTTLKARHGFRGLIYGTNKPQKKMGKTTKATYVTQKRTIVSTSNGSVTRKKEKNISLSFIKKKIKKKEKSNITCKKQHRHGLAVR